jgi:hypothetical protein
MELFELIKTIPSVFDNIALDCVLILILFLFARRYFSSATKSISAISRTRQRANTLRKTLELKADEVATLREALNSARLKTESNMSPLRNELQARELFAKIASQKTVGREHEELQQRLDQAAQKHPRTH